MLIVKFSVLALPLLALPIEQQLLLIVVLLLLVSLELGVWRFLSQHSMHSTAAVIIWRKLKITQDGVNVSEFFRLRSAGVRSEEGQFEALLAWTE